MSPATWTSMGPGSAVMDDCRFPNLRMTRGNISCAGSLRRVDVPKTMAEGKYIGSRRCPERLQKAFQKAWTLAPTCSGEIVGIKSTIYYRFSERIIGVFATHPTRQFPKRRACGLPVTRVPHRQNKIPSVRDLEGSTHQRLAEILHAGI